MTQAIATRPAADDVDAFIAKWRSSGGAELANAQLFLSELCDLLGVPRPDPTLEDDALNTYVFEKAVTFRHGDGSTSAGRIDLYRLGCFVLEAKQGSGGDSAPAAPSVPLAAPLRRKLGTAVRGSRGWSQAMDRAYGQAAQYARALPEWPPFLVVVDVGHAFALFANFARDGKAYLPFPDPATHRFLLDDLADPKVLDRLRRLWTDPLSLDPSRHAAKVTTHVAERLAVLATSLERQGHSPDLVADFLMRCLFTMFAEDVGLLPKDGFTKLLADMRETPAGLAAMIESLWRDMDRGGFSPALRQTILRFNGRFFHDVTVLPLDAAQIDLLIDAARTNWSEVEPAIFGTLLERALDPTERHALGAHFTPRAYVERLVFPTVIEPLRDEWQTVKAAAMTLLHNETGTERTRRERHDKAIETLRDFRRQLCAIRVLDPACGTGNFLYITLEHIKRLEGEVLETLADLGAGQEALDLAGVTVDPHQFLGIEKNPRAAAIAELVLWIGYLQWHYRQHGRVAPAEPVLRDFRNIEHRDAVLAYDAEEVVLDDSGRPVTRWDGETMKKHPVTGKDVPDETATRVLYRYVNARRAEWPEADFIVSNPPFLGKLHVVSDLGEGYAEALRAAYRNDVPDGVDFVMYWWFKAAELARAGRVRRFGFITTNSITQTFNRRVVAAALDASPPIRLAFTVPDHPWVDSTDGAAVRISMTAGDTRTETGVFATVESERPTGSDSVHVDVRERRGVVNADLSLGADVSSAVALQANRALASMGPALGSRGFVLSEDEKRDLMQRDGDQLADVVRPLRNGRDLLYSPRGVYAIDLHGLDITTVRTKYPALTQHLLQTVYPERAENRDPKLRENWWLFRRSNELFRSMLAGVDRYILTVETAKHRLFFMQSKDVLAEHGTISIALDDYYFLGILSSRAHVPWALAAGGTLEDRPRYNKTRCFDPFPFPAPTEPQAARIRELAEALDAHRKARQAAHPDLTLTNTYNVLAKLREGTPLTAKDKKVHEQALCSVLLKLHDDLDVAVFAAYGWPPSLTDEEILERLVALNAERAEEERRGLVRYLRPDYQAPAASSPAPSSEPDADTPDTPAAPPSPLPPTDPPPWPPTLVDRVRLVRATLQSLATPVTPESLARHFKRAPTDQVQEILDTLVLLGQARPTGQAKYTL